MLPILLLLLAATVHGFPPDKPQVSGLHIIKTRSIDLNNAHGLAMEPRLENTMEPTAYDLYLEPYLEDAVFKGNVSINVTWLRDTDEVSVHCAHELEISAYQVKVRSSDGEKLITIPVRKLSMDLKKPVATLYLEREVKKGSTGQLEFSFNGNLETATTEAFFKTTYTEQETEKMMVATQLRPNNARRVFPCFDEPAFRTPIKLTVVRPRNFHAFSNAVPLETHTITDEPNALRDIFNTTPPIPVSMFGLVIGELEYVNRTEVYVDKFGNEIQLLVWARPEFLPALQDAPKKLLRVMTELAAFWQIRLPMQRLDVVALPNYHGAKPADSWGLIVFKESDLASRGYLQLAQELSYQWLGGLTTPAWWSDAHLNKALVGYLAAETAFKINNGSEMEGKWPMTVLYSLYYEYSKRYPHSRITGMKQETACTKIELLFRMFNYTLGADTFRCGLRRFLEAHKLKTFTGDDIWKELNDAAHKGHKIPDNLDLKTIARSWINKDRLPVITVTRNPDNNELTFVQKVYLRERPHDVPDADRMTWMAPIVVTRGDSLDFNNTTPAFWMTNQKETKALNLPGKKHFIIVNPEEIAPFPVNYDSNNWALLAKFLRTEGRLRIPELTRAKLLHDAWNLAFAGQLAFDTAFDMTLFMTEERHHLVWDPVFTMIDHIGRHIWPIHEKFQAYISIMLTPLYEELSKDVKEEEDGSLKNLRSLTWTFLCQAGWKPCVVEAQLQYKKWMDAKNPDAGNPIANQFICPVFKYGTVFEWMFGLERVANFPPSRKQNERTYLLKTLAGCPVDGWEITRLLNITVLESNGNFTETDVFLIFSMLNGNAKGYTTLLHFLADNWDTLKQKYQSKTNLWDNLITSATSHFTTKQGLKEVTQFYKNHQGEFGSAEHIIEKSIRNIMEEVKWSDENLPIIEKWLDNFLEQFGSKDNQAFKKTE